MTDRLRGEHLFAYSAQLRPPQWIGPVAEGLRINFWVAGGEATGPRLAGRLRPEGADFFTVRPDGVGLLKVQAVIEDAEGALIALDYEGLSDLGAEGYERMLAGRPPSTLRLFTTPRIRSQSPAYADLARCLCVAVGEADLEQLTVRYDVYALR